MGMVTVNGPDARAATFESGGNCGGPSSWRSGQGMVMDGATTSARSFSRPSASTVGPRLRLPMKIAELFVANVTRDIPPVVYFHEQRPEKLKEEVGEYIITGGYRENDPRSQRVKQGIHEQFVHLLRGITQEIGKKGGSENPACWISGFYGSG